MQHQHLHVARAADGRKMIDLTPRGEIDWSDNVKQFIHRKTHNTNGEALKLDVPANFAVKDSDNSGVATAVSVVYVTMSPTFTGSVVAYVTQTNDPNASSTAASIASTSAVQLDAVSTASDSSSNAATAASTASSAVNFTPMVGTPTYTSRQTTSAASTNTAISNANSNLQNPSISQQGTGLTDGAKAGLAIGILLAIALAAGLGFFCWKRQKKNGHDELNEKTGYNEKRTSLFGSGLAGKRASADSDKSFGTIHNTATAPRLSLRPVTQFLPTFGEKRKSSNPLNGPQMSEQPSAWERRADGAQNPFADHSEATNPFEQGDARSTPSNSAKQSMDASLGTATAVPAPRGPNNVHRVQLDFKPSMDDELELKSGQLVRMLHEYDDGWALCVRMDRSQQGVAPRTCLSKQPVKPRGPPPAGRTSPQNGMRGPPPPGAQRPMAPQPNNVARKPVPGQAI